MKRYKITVNIEESEVLDTGDPVQAMFDPSLLYKVTFKNETKGHILYCTDIPLESIIALYTKEVMEALFSELGFENEQ